jgi:hypothetical protein
VLVKLSIIRASELILSKHILRFEFWRCQSDLDFHSTAKHGDAKIKTLQEIFDHEFDEDFSQQVSKKGGYKLTAAVSPEDESETDLLICERKTSGGVS